MAAARPPRRPPASRKPRTQGSIGADEWVGGSGLMPLYVEGDEPYRPEMVLWVSRHSLLGARAVLPGQGEDDAAALLGEILARVQKKSERPRRLRVASPRLAELLRVANGGALEVVLAPTPEVDAILAEFAEVTRSGELSRVARRRGDEPELHGPTYLGGGRIPEALVAQFFRSAARLHRVAPWNITSGDSDVLTVDVPAYGARGLCASIIGQARESFGFILFESFARFQEFLRTADDADDEEERGGFPGQRVLSVDFSRREDVAPSMLREVSAHRWELPSKQAIPVIMALDEAQIPVPLIEKDVALVTACCEGLARFFEQNPRWEWSPSKRKVERFVIDVLPDRPSIVVTAPAGGPLAHAGPSHRMLRGRAVVPKPPAKPTTPAAIGRILGDVWGRTFNQRHKREVDLAVEEIVGATALTDAGEIDELEALAGSLPWAWAALWRPMTDGETGLDKARRLSAKQPPVVAAALGWLARARCTYAEVVSVDARSGRVRLRDLFDGAAYEVGFDPTQRSSLTRHLRFFGLLTELGDGTHHYPSALLGNAGLESLSPARLLEETRGALAGAGIDPDEIDPAAPHAGLTRWAGFALGRVLAHLLAEQRKPPPKRYLVTSTGERVEVHEGKAKLSSRGRAALVSALALAADFHRDDKASWTFLDRSLTSVHAGGESVGSVACPAGVLRVTATSEARFDRLMKRLEELAGTALPLQAHTVACPWAGNPGVVERDEPTARRVIIAQSLPMTGPPRPVGTLVVDQLRSALDLPIEDLGGAPRALVGTPEGRARVEGWLREAELQGMPGQGEAAYLDLDALRVELGLPPLGS